MGKGIQLSDPLLLPTPGDGGGIVQGQLPPGENGDGFGQKVLQILLKPPGGNIVLTQDDNRTFCIPAESGNQVAPVDLSDAGNGGGFSGGDPAQQSIIFRNAVQHLNQLFHKSTS